MKILALTDYQCCYLSHSLLTGLHETGHEIWELPVLNSVRGGVDKGYDLPDGTLGYSGTPGYLQVNPLPPYDKPELSPEIINSFDLIVMLSGRDYARRAFQLIHEITGKSPGQLPIVLCDGEDYDFIDRDILNLVKPPVFFKRELLKKYNFASYSGAFGRPIFPLPFAAFTRSTDLIDVGEDKDYDFFLSLGDTHELRRTLVKSLLDERVTNAKFNRCATWIACNSEDSNIRGRVDAMMAWPEYIRRQARSRLTVVIRGYGRDTLHCWEAFSHPTAVLYVDPEIYIPHPFTQDHCLLLEEKDVPNVPRHAMALLSHYVEMSSMGARGNAHCRKYHSTKARASYLIEIAMKVIGGEKVHYEEFGLGYSNYPSYVARTSGTS